VKTEMSQKTSLVDRINRESVFRGLLWIFAAILFVFAIVPVVHSLRGESIKDYAVWYETGQQVLHRGQVYPGRWHKFPFMYPPPCALFLAPISALGKTGLVVTLVLANAAAWICSVIFSVRLATGERPGHVLLYFVPSFIVGVYVWGNFLLGQPSLILLALLLGAFIFLERKRNVAAGILIAIAATIKAFPILAIVYLLYRRYWTAAIAAVLTLAFLLILAPIPFRGYALAKQDLQRWSSGMLFKYDESGIGQREGRSNSWRNQSIWGVSNRLLRHVEYNPSYAPHVAVYANFFELKFATVNIIILVTGLLLGLIFIGVMPAAPRRRPETDAIEFALLVLLILIFTPLSFGYLFAWLLYPLTVILHRLLLDPRSQLLGLTAAAILCLSLSIPLRIMAQTYGNTLLATLLLFIGLALDLRRLKRA
jgi:hypothetical protein